MKDISYGSSFFRLFLNRFTRKGKKNYSEKIAYNFIRNLKRSFRKNPFLVLEQATSRLMPVIGVKSKRVAGVSVKIPILLKPSQEVSLGVKWFLEGVRNRANMHKLDDRIFSELNDVISSKRVVAIKKRNELHKLASAGRPFLRKF